MPAISGPDLTVLLSIRNSDRVSTNPGLPVICAWPVSGQYGIGSRVLYYALVAACVFARKIGWLRNPCLAAALLIPAVAALHAIVLAAVNAPGAIDMDIYGAFQVCAIAILAAPVTVSSSQTYFNDSGRNTIFAWSTLILAGLISLTIQFYRSEASTICKMDYSGKPISSDPAAFPYGFKCNLTCSPDDPTSPLRGGSANNIYVIPTPTLLDFNTVTLLSAACCLPSVLLLVNMWLKILENNARKVNGSNEAHSASVGTQEQPNDAEAYGENGGSEAMPSPAVTSDDETSPGDGDAVQEAGHRKDVILKMFKKYIELPLFAGAIITILILGERNLFSKQVRFQNEPVANIGQWGPIVGTALGVAGSFYILLAQAVVLEQTEEKQKDPPKQTEFLRRTARVLLRVSDWFGTPREGTFDDGVEYAETKAREYPTIPGEAERLGDELSRVLSAYDQGSRDSIDGSPSGISRPRSRSRAGSFRSTRSGVGVEGSPKSPTAPFDRRRRSTLEVPSSGPGRIRESLRHERTNSGASHTSTGSDANIPPMIRITSMDETTASPEQSPIADSPPMTPMPELPPRAYGPPSP